MTPETTIVVEGSDDIDLDELRETIEKAVTSLEVPFNLIVLGDRPVDPLLRKALSDHENETARRLAKELHPEEAGLIERVYAAWGRHRDKAIKQIAEMLSK